MIKEYTFVFTSEFIAISDFLILVLLFVYFQE